MSWISSKVSSKVVKMMNDLVMDAVMDAVMKCADKFNFSGEEAMRFLELSLSEEGKSKECKLVEVVVKSRFPLPYNGRVDNSRCQGLVINNNLFTQCEKGMSPDSCYCVTHKKQADKSAGGIPEHGNMSQRQECSAMSFISPSGKRPIVYSKVMKKLGLKREEVEEEASKLGITLDEYHFEEEKVVVKENKVEDKKGKGRPKKDKPSLEVAEDMDDMFASLVAKSSTSQVVVVDQTNEHNEMISADKESKQANKIYKKEDKDAAKKKEKEEKDAAKKAEKEATKKAEKEAKEAKRKEKEEKDAAKEAKKKEKEAKESKKQAKKEVKKEDKVVKKAEIVVTVVEDPPAVEEDMNDELESLMEASEEEEVSEDEEGSECAEESYDD